MGRAWAVIERSRESLLREAAAARRGGRGFEVS
jgi:hypothetical protein